MKGFWKLVNVGLLAKIWTTVWCHTVYSDIFCLFNENHMNRINSERKLSYECRHTSCVVVEEIRSRHANSVNYNGWKFPHGSSSWRADLPSLAQHCIVMAHRVAKLSADVNGRHSTTSSLWGHHDAGHASDTSFNARQPRVPVAAARTCNALPPAAPYSLRSGGSLKNTFTR